MTTLPETKEAFSSQIPALQVLMTLGYEYLSPDDALKRRGGNLNDLLLKDVLVSELRKRRFTFKGIEYPLSTNAIDEIVRELSDSRTNEGLLVANEKIYDHLTLGISVTEFVDGQKAQPTIPIIDWSNPSNNQFHVTDEFEVLNTSGTGTRRPDIICFVNGIPVTVIEAKRPDPHNPHKDMVEEGVSQNIRNQGVAEIPHLFAYSHLLMAMDGTGGRYATTRTPSKYWAKWRDEDYDEDYYRAIKNTSLTDEKKATLFGHREAAARTYFDAIESQGERIPTDQDRLLISLASPERLLEIIHFFVVFDKKDGKIIARYQQYFGIRKLIRQIKTKDPKGARLGGVIWHTTGSGKSLTMVFLAKALIYDHELKHCRFVAVTDRIDLETQLSKVFAAAGALPPKKEGYKARNGRDLAARICKGTDRIVFSLINKFGTAARNEECLNDSSDIIVLVDEGHRSHGGENHERMRMMMPNAAYVAFTGTPLLKDDKTRNKFGPIVHAYTMRQAVEDGTVTPLLYEERIPELGVNTKAIDAWFDRITEGLTDSQKTDLKKRFAKQGEIYGSESRIELIAHDITDHYVKNVPDGLKAQLATDSKLSAIRYKRHLDEIGLITSAIVMSPPDTREGHTEVDESKIPEVQQWWKDNVGNQDEEVYTRDVISRFGDEDEPQLLIVVSKLLTGFNEPRNSVLYIDKKLEQHNLIQAIARINRLHEKKKHGLLIDYRGILKQLDTAIREYQDLEEYTQGGFDINDIEGLYQQTSTEYKRLPLLHEKLWAIFTDVQNKGDLEQYRQVLIPKYETDENGDDYDTRQRIREDFYEALHDFGLCLEVALGSAYFFQDKNFPEELINQYKQDLRFFTNLRRLVRRDAGETLDYSEYQDRIRKLISKHVVGENIREPEGVYLINELGKEQPPEEWTEEKTRNETDVIKTRVRRTIEQKLQDDPYAQKVFSELLEDVIAQAESMFDHPFQQYALFNEFEKQVEERRVPDIPDTFDGWPHAKAYYGVFKLVLGESAFTGIPDEKAQEYVDLAFEVDQTVDQAVAENSLNPQNIESAIRQGLLPRLFKAFGMDKAKAIIDQVIKITRVGVSKVEAGY
ncbi:MAG: HsdR family type I site-specific deoxyribonuclease [Sedimenticola sp.]